MAAIDFLLNGSAVSVDLADPAMPLLYVLRNECGLNNPHFGCGLAQCGACTVHVNGQPTRSCVYPARAVGGAHVTTLEGLGTPEHPHPVQTALIDEQAFFCGYCLNGWVMTAAALMRDNPVANDADFEAAFAGLQCRCGSHMAIIRALKALVKA